MSFLSFDSVLCLPVFVSTCLCYSGGVPSRLVHGVFTALSCELLVCAVILILFFGAVRLIYGTALCAPDLSRNSELVF